MWELGRIKVDCGIAYQSVLDFNCISAKNQYSEATVTLRLSGVPDTNINDRLEGTKVSVHLSDGTCVIKGVCAGAILSTTAGYSEITLHIYSAAYALDQDKRNRSFQNPNKTLSAIVNQLVKSRGGYVNVDKDQTVKQVITQRDETDWRFITRIAGSYGKNVFENNKSNEVELYIGNDGTQSKKWEDDFVIKQTTRNLAQCTKANAIGNRAMPYDFEQLTVVTYNPTLAAGYRIGDYVIQKAEVRTVREILTNVLTLMRPASEETSKATAVRRNVASNYFNFYKGTVLEVEGTNVKVHFSVDENQGKGEAAWMPYESSISNYFYSMPDEGDTVFVYYESTGLAICMGSMHTNTDNPDFLNPKDKMLTTQDNMIKFSERFMEMISGRTERESDGDQYSSIELSLDDGITVYGKGMINVASSESGDIEISADKDGGYLDLWAMEDIYLSVSTSIIHIDDDQVYLNAPYFYWEGFIKASGYEYKEDIYKEEKKKGWFDVFLSAAQLVLDVASVFTPPLISSALSLVSAGISFAKGDVAGGLMGLAGAIPLVGNVAKAGKLANAAGKAGKMVKSAKNVISGIKYAKQIGLGIKLTVNLVSGGMAVIDLSQKVPQIIDLYKKGEFDPFRDPDDMVLLLETLSSGVNVIGSAKDMYGDIKDYKKPKTPDVPGTPDKPKDIEGADNTAKSEVAAGSEPKELPEGSAGKQKTTSLETENGKATNNNTYDGDPVDMVTGSLYMHYTDMVLNDITGEFRIERTYESVYTNEKRLLGNKWTMNIETRIYFGDNRATIRMQDNHLEHFVKTKKGWVNERHQDKSVHLEEVGGEYYLYVLKEKKKYYFNQQGLLLYIYDNNKNATRFTYQGNKLISIQLASGQKFTLLYRENKLQSISDAIGRTVSYEYEGEYLTSVLYSNEGRIRYEYTPEGYIYKVWDQKGVNYITNKYDRKGRVTRQIMSNGEEYLYLYDDAHKVNSIITVSKNRSIRYEYNQNQLVTRTWYEDNTYKEIKYDEWDNPIYEKDRNGNETFRIYSQEGNLLEVRTAEGLCTKYVYDEHNNLLSKTDNYGRELKFAYDRNGNVILREEKIDDKQWNKVVYTYDENGRLLTKTDANGNTITLKYDTMFSYPSKYQGAEGEVYSYTYDAAGRNMSLQGELGTVKYGYNAMDYCTHEIDAQGNVTRYFYDQLNNLVKKVLPREYDPQQDDGVGICYTYDDMDHRIAIIDALGNITASHKDSEGNILKEIHPNTYQKETKDGEGITYTYNSDGYRTHIHYPNGGVERIFYDSVGNIIKKIHPLEYDSVTDDGKGYTYLYDKENRLVQITNPDGVVEKRYIYDLAGRIIKVINTEGYLAGNDDESRVGTLYTYNLAGWILEKREPVVIKENGEVLYQLTSHEYDKVGNMTQEKRYLDYQSKTSAGGKVNIIRKEYDKSNRLIKVADLLGAVVEYRYNSHNQLVYEKRRINENHDMQIGYLYDEVGRVKEIIRSADEAYVGRRSVRTTYHYDKNGNLIKTITPLGTRISRSYDLANRLIREVHEEEGGMIHNETTFTYDAAGNLICVTDNEGACISYTYDLLNRVTTIRGKNGGTQKIEYDLNGRIIKEISPKEYQLKGENARGYQYTYDMMGRITTVTAPDGTVEEVREYDTSGRMISSLDGMGSGIKISYDFGGRRTEISTMEERTQSYLYNAAGNIIGVKDGNGNHTEYTLDCWGRIVSIRKADGSVETFSYDYAGNMATSTDGEGNTITYTYNSINKLSTRTDALGETETYHYDAEGRVGAYRDRNGVTTTYRYNCYGNLISRQNQSSGEQEIFGYSAEGLLKYAIAGGMRYDYTYYPDGSLKEKKASGRTLIAYEYDLNGNKTCQTDISGKRTEYTYNLKNLLESVSDGGRTLAKYSYYPDGRIKSILAGEDIIHSYGYDRDKNLTELSTGFGMIGNEIFLVNNHYRYDKNGNCTTKEMLTGIHHYQYDTQNRIVKAEYPTYSESFYYDKNGNRTGYVGNGMEVEYHYGAGNRLTEMTTRQGGKEELTEFTYDKQGNLLKDGKARYNYDSFNRLQKAETFDGRVQINHYDGEGLRHEIEENGKLVQFIYSGREVVVETDVDNTLTRYIRGYELISADCEKARTYYHYCNDELGSVTHILDENGKVCNHYTYDAFGNTFTCEETVSNRFCFAGQQYDSITEQYYLRARYYNPVIGRFIQEDTYYGDGLNLYAYCENNPVRYIDPSGYNKIDAHDKLNGDQQALHDIVDEANKSCGVTPDEKAIIYDWADEYGVDKNSLDVKDKPSNSPSQGGSETKAKPYTNSRPSYRNGVVDQVWENAKGPDGFVRDPNTGDIINWTPGEPRKGVWDMGHIPGEKYSDMHDLYMNGDISKNEFLDWFNDPNNYRPELPSNNRSHRYE